MGTHTETNKAGARSGIPFLATAFKKSLIIRTALAAVLLAASLFTAGNQALTMILRIFSVIISGCDMFYDAFCGIKNGRMLNSPLIAITAAVVSLMTGNSSEGALLCILYQAGSILVGYISRITDGKAIRTIKSAEIRDTIKKVLEYRSAPELDIQEGIEKTFFPLLMGMVLIALLYLIALPVFGHLNFSIALKRSLVIILLAEPESLCSSFRSLGKRGICIAAGRGTVLNCVKGLNDSGGKYMISVPRDSSPGYIGVKPAAMERDAFISFAVHTVCKSHHRFAKFIISYYNMDYDESLITDCEDVEGGVTGSINGMPVLFGTAGMLYEHGINIENPIPGRYYMYLKDKYVGSMEPEYPEEPESDLSGIARKADVLAVENASLTFVFKAVLLIPVFTGYCSLSIAAFIGIAVSTLTLLNTKRLDKELNGFDNLFCRYFD